MEVGGGWKGKKGGCNSPEDMSYLRGGGARVAGRAEGGAMGHLSQRQPKPPPTTQLLRHFSSGWGAQKELAGGVVSLFPM